MSSEVRRTSRRGVGAALRRLTAPALSQPRPRLSVCTVAGEEGPQFERWILHVLDYADELVVAVDAAAADGTLAMARRYADRVDAVEHPRCLEQIADHALRGATGEWILVLRPDEWMSGELIAALPALLRERDLTHYLIGTRWVVDDDGKKSWLRQHPWHPDHRVRLVRNIASIYRHPLAPGTDLIADGEGRALDPDEGAVYRTRLVQMDRGTREEMARSHAIDGARSSIVHLLHEDYASSLCREEVPAGELDGPPTARALERAGERWQRYAVERPPSERIHLHLLAPILAATAAEQDDAPVFGVRWHTHTTPRAVLPNRGYGVELELENTADAAWRTTGSRAGRVMLSYHWDNAAGRVVHEGERTLIPRRVTPGETVRVQAGLWTPFEPGLYVLQWDLVAEGRGWFSANGVTPLSCEVCVSDEERLLDWRR